MIEIDWKIRNIGSDGGMTVALTAYAAYPVNGGDDGFAQGDAKCGAIRSPADELLFSGTARQGLAIGGIDVDASVDGEGVVAASGEIDVDGSIDGKSLIDRPCCIDKDSAVERDRRAEDCKGRGKGRESRKSEAALHDCRMKGYRY